MGAKRFAVPGARVSDQLPNDPARYRHLIEAARSTLWLVSIQKR